MFLLALVSLSGFSQLNWSTAVYYATPTTTALNNSDAMWLGDFNNDTKNDVIIRHWLQNKMTLYLNSGDGTFNAASTITSNRSLNTIVLADFNNDNNLDIAATNADYDGTINLVSIHLGNGDGSFKPVVSYSCYGDYKYTLDAGDITGDGFKDLVLSSAGWDGFVILVNNGDGTFSEGNHYASTHECSSIKLADFNGDTHLDVALGNGTTAYNSQIDLFFGNGDGTFNPTFSSYLTAKHPQLLLGDVDNQNGTDIVFDVPENHASYYLKNDGNGNFTQILIKENYDVTGVCDWNNDHYMDMVAIGWDPVSKITTGTYLILNEGADVFSEPIVLDASYNGFISKLNDDNYFDFAYIKVAQKKMGVKLQIVTPPTGMNQPNSENTLQIYPNPAHDVLYINTGSNSANSANYSIKIVNTLGQTVFENPIDSQLMGVDVSKLGANSIYFVQVIDHNGQLIDVRKIILD